MPAVPGASWVPAASLLSAYRTRVVHIALASPQVTAKYQRFGSIESMAPEDIAPVSVPVAAPVLGAPAALADAVLAAPVLPPDEEHPAATRPASATVPAVRAHRGVSHRAVARRGGNCAGDIAFSDRFALRCAAAGPAALRGSGRVPPRGGAHGAAAAGG